MNLHFVHDLLVLEKTLYILVICGYYTSKLAIHMSVNWRTSGKCKYMYQDQECNGYI